MLKIETKGNDANCSGYRIQAKINGDNLNNINHETNRNFRNKKGEYLKDKIDELATNIRDLYRGINDFKRGYQARSNLVKYENCDLLADYHIISERWKIYFSQLLNVHRVSDLRQIKIQLSR
jgi:hypothetical protein